MTYRLTREDRRGVEGRNPDAASELVEDDIAVVTRADDSVGGRIDRADGCLIRSEGVEGRPELDVNHVESAVAAPDEHEAPRRGAAVDKVCDPDGVKLGQGTAGVEHADHAVGPCGDNLARGCRQRRDDVRERADALFIHMELKRRHARALAPVPCAETPVLPAREEHVRAAAAVAPPRERGDVAPVDVLHWPRVPPGAEVPDEDVAAPVPADKGARGAGLQLQHGRGVALEAARQAGPRGLHVPHLDRLVVAATDGQPGARVHPDLRDAGAVALERLADRPVGGPDADLAIHSARQDLPRGRVRDAGHPLGVAVLLRVERPPEAAAADVDAVQRVVAASDDRLAGAPINARAQVGAVGKVGEEALGIPRALAERGDNRVREPRTGRRAGSPMRARPSRGPRRSGGGRGSGGGGPAVA
mmetsp:Transcript_30207/g.71907  ORF Transcript_30207/g.71907 Transcript_30207/m.71907 type:complete len:418 (+) Transcript_30207:691-1944(+)